MIPEPAKLFSRENRFERSLYLAKLENADEWPSDFDLGTLFVLLLTIDDSEYSDDQIKGLVRKLFSQGATCANLCGNDQSRLHELADEVRDEDALFGPITTSSYFLEELDNCLWASIVDSSPDDEWLDRYPDGEWWDHCAAVLGVVVGLPECALRVEQSFTDPERFVRECLERDD